MTQPGMTVSNICHGDCTETQADRATIVSETYLSSEPVLMFARQTLKRWLREMAQADLQGNACKSGWQHSQKSDKVLAQHATWLHSRHSGEWLLQDAVKSYSSIAARMANCTGLCVLHDVCLVLTPAKNGVCAAKASRLAHAEPCVDNARVAPAIPAEQLETLLPMQCIGKCALTEVMSSCLEGVWKRR